MQILNHINNGNKMVVSFSVTHLALLRTAITVTGTSAHIPLCELRKLCKQGCLEEALNILHMKHTAWHSSTYVCLLQSYVENRDLAGGKRIHYHLNQNGFTADGILGNTLLNMYVKCGTVRDARKVFDEMLERDVCSWTVMIAAYARRGHGFESLTLFQQMQSKQIRPNEFAFSSVLYACAKLQALQKGMAIHQDIIRSGLEYDVALANALVDMYAKCGSIDKARKLFDKMPERNVVSWTSMITAYARQGLACEALSVFCLMQQAGIEPNDFTFATVLSACAKLGYLEPGEEIHEKIVRGGLHSDAFVMSSLVDMYAKCGMVEKAQTCFQKIYKPDVVSWNAMVAGYAQNGLIDKALKLFRAMPQRDVFSWTAMIVGYVQNGFVDEALQLFEETPHRDMFSWTAMIAGLAQNGHSNEAINLFAQMVVSDVKPDSNTFVSVLPACTSLAALEKGREIHEKIITNGFQSDIFVMNALIDMYAKCGIILKSWRLFEKMHWRDLASWNVIIGAHAMHGYGKKALELFEQMKDSGMNPDRITFVSVLSACSHAGMVDEGYQYFNNMTDYCHITPTMEHYSCMVDVLGRAGHLDEAEDFINKMPVKPDATVWTSLLAACRMHNNVELAGRIAEYIFELDIKDAAPYVLLSNIYAAGGRWADLKNIRTRMEDMGIKKTPGCSWIEVNKKVHGFLGGDRQTRESKQLCYELCKMASLLQE